MAEQPALLLLLALAVLAILFLVFKYVQLQGQFNQRLQEQVTLWKDRELLHASEQLQQTAMEQARNELVRWKMENEAGIRSDAINRSSAVVRGKVTEHLAPYIGAFPYDPKDIRFLGSPIDLIVFDGMSEGHARQVVFIEVKTNTSTLNSTQRRIRDAIVAGHVTWRELRL